MKSVVVDAILFDNDGTLIDSSPGVLAAWKVFGAQYGLDGEAMTYQTHGRRLVDTIAEYCHVTGDELAKEVDRFEQIVIDVGPVILPGAKDLLESIDKEGGKESPRWAIVTSATSGYANAALRKAGVPLPPILVSSSDVLNGKPLPDPYLAGAEKCKVDPTKCLVVEDAPSGLKSGREAGAKTLAVCTTHTRRDLASYSPDFTVTDLTKVSARWVDGKLEVTMDEAE